MQISPFPASEPGVYILEAMSVSNGSPPVPMLLSSEAPGVSTNPPVPGTGVGDTALSAYGAPESSAAGEVISLVDSPGRVLDSRSQFLIDDSSSTASAIVVRPRDERSKTEEAAISAALEGRTPARSSRHDGYMAIPKSGGSYRDWPAVIAYLVTELEVSRRAVTAQDLRQLKKWAHNHGAVLRRAAQAGSSASAVGPPQGGASQIARGAKKRARTAAVVTAVEKVQVISVPVRERRGPRFFDPHGPPTEGDFASAGRRTAVPDFGEAASSAGITALWMFPCRLLQLKLRLALALLLSWILLRLYGQAARHHLGATARWVGALSCRPRLFSLRRSMNLIPPVLLLLIAMRRWPSHAVILGCSGAGDDQEAS